MAFRMLKRTWVTCAVIAATVAWQSNITWAGAINAGFDLIETGPGGASLDLTPMGLGVVSMNGFAMGPGDTDTIVHRTTGLPAGGIGPISSEIIDLNLRSASDIVNFGFFGNLHPHSVIVSLRTGIGNESLGTVTVTSHNDGAADPGGKFSSNFTVKAKATFFDEMDNVVHSTVDLPDDTLMSTNADWTHAPPINYPNSVAHPSGGFHIGPVLHLGPHIFTFPADEGGSIPDGGGHLPPLCEPGEGGVGYFAHAAKHAQWAVNPAQMIIDLELPSKHCPTILFAETFVEFDTVHDFDSFLDANFRITNPSTGEETRVHVVLNGPGQTIVRGNVSENGQVATTGAFDTELADLQLSGEVQTPAGPLTIQIREDPDRLSLGRTVISRYQEPDILVEPIGAAIIPVLLIPYCNEDSIPLPGGLGALDGWKCHTPLEIIEFLPLGDGRFLEKLRSELTGMINIGTGRIPFKVEGITEVMATAPDPGQTELNQPGTYQTEVIAMNLTGTLPTGQTIRIRESPQVDSPGVTEVTEAANGKFQVVSDFNMNIDVAIGDGDFQRVTTPIDVKQGSDGGFRTESSFMVFTELSVDGGQTWVKSEGAADMRWGEPKLAGDTDDDGDVDVQNIVTVVTNYTGKQGTTQETLVNKYRQHGDSDDDRDVDVPDVIAAVSAYTGNTQEPAGPDAGNIGDRPDHPDLIYDPTTGNVILDPSDILGTFPSGIWAFVFDNAAGGDDFDPAMGSGEPESAFGGVGNLSVTNREWTNPFNAFDAVVDLGNIFPTGLSLAQLETFLLTADYSAIFNDGDLLSPKQTAEWDLVPEPGSMTLFGIGLLALLSLRRRGR